MSMIPKQVIFYEILPRLPAKSIFRFRCVSKEWNSLLQDPYFLHLHQSISIHCHFLFACPKFLHNFLRSGFDHRFFNLNVFTAPLLLQPQQPPHEAVAEAAFVATTPHVDDQPNIDVQCVNGFLCFHSKRPYIMCASSIQVFNPTTRQLIAIPDDAIIRPRSFNNTLIIRHVTFGTHFCYDPSGHEFKILRLIMSRGVYRFRILTVGGGANNKNNNSNNSWTDIAPIMPFDPTICISVTQQKGVCVNGAMYWVYRSDSKEQKLVSFDLRNRQFGMIALPPGHASNPEMFHPWKIYRELIDLGGCLSVIGYSAQSCNLNIWILKDLRSEVWMKQSIRLPYDRIDLPWESAWRQYLLCPLGKTNNTGEILFVPYFLGKQERVEAYYYDTERKSFRSVVIAEFPQVWQPKLRRGLLVDMFFYQENLRIL